MQFNKYEKPSLTTDMVLFRIETKESESNRKVTDKELQILLVKRNKEPQKGYLSLPGGFVSIDEEISTNVSRKLHEKTGIIGDFYIEQLYTKGEINRDPRGRVISVSYLGLCNKETYNNNTLTPDVDWYNIDTTFNDKILAFDHKEIISYALERLKNKVEYTDIVFNLLPKEFTIADCQAVYEILLGKKIQNFRRKINAYITPLDKKEEGKAFRPAELFSVNPNRESRF